MQGRTLAEDQGLLGRQGGREEAKRPQPKSNSHTISSFGWQLKPSGVNSEPGRSKSPVPCTQYRGRHLEVGWHLSGEKWWPQRSFLAAAPLYIFPIKAPAAPFRVPSALVTDCKDRKPVPERGQGPQQRGLRSGFLPTPRRMWLCYGIS